MPSGYTDRVFNGDYCGVYEIAEFAKVSKAQVAHWLETEWFPRPLDGPRMGRVWDYKAVVAALAARGYPKDENEGGKRGPRKRYSFDNVPTGQD